MRYLKSFPLFEALDLTHEEIDQLPCRMIQKVWADEIYNYMVQRGDGDPHKPFPPLDTSQIGLKKGSRSFSHSWGLSLNTKTGRAWSGRAVELKFPEVFKYDSIEDWNRAVGMLVLYSSTPYDQRQLRPISEGKPFKETSEPMIPQDLLRFAVTQSMGVTYREGFLKKLKRTPDLSFLVYFPRTLEKISASMDLKEVSEIVNNQIEKNPDTIENLDELFNSEWFHPSDFVRKLYSAYKKGM
jgi:hypothetical protein